MSDSAPPVPSSPKDPSPPIASESVPSPDATSNNATGAGPSHDAPTDVGVAPPPLSIASSSVPSAPSPSSHQPSPSPGGKYENTKELKQLREKIESLGNKGNFGEQAELLRKGEDTLAKHFHLMEELMINLDPSHSTTAMIVSLSVMFDGAANKKMEPLMMRAAEILKTLVENKSIVREQVIHVIDYYVSLFRKVTRFLIQKDQSVNGIAFLQGAIDLIVDAGDQTITTLHGCLFTLCLKVHAITPGLEYLYSYVRGVLNETSPTASPSSNGSVNADSRSLLTYLYYGGLLAARANQWKRASNLLETACFVPGFAVSEIQIEALKKLHIISFIAYGKLVHPMRSPNLTKAWKQQGAVYSQLAAELEKTHSEWEDEGGSRAWKQNEPLTTDEIAGRAKTVNKLMLAHTKVFERDQNTELLSILMHEFKLRSVLRIAEVYKVVSIPRITELANLDGIEETKQLLNALIVSGRLLASDDGEDYIRLEFPVVAQSPAEINERQQKMTSITEDIKRLDVASQKTPYYCQRTAKSGNNQPDDEGLSMSNAPEQAWPIAPTSVPS